MGWIKADPLVDIGFTDLPKNGVSQCYRLPDSGAPASALCSARLLAQRDDSVPEQVHRRSVVLTYCCASTQNIRIFEY